MSAAPSVTIVIPAFNAMRWIGETLASVVHQTYPHDCIEVVVVDDGSTDGTANEASRILAATDLAHSVLRNETSCGPSLARNRGWRHGTGEWIQFLDADDLLTSDKLAVQMSLVRSHPTAAVIFSPWARLIFDGSQWVDQSPYTNPSIGSDAVLDLIRTENFIQLGSALFSRRWVERVGGFNESLKFIEDVDLLLRIAITGGQLHQAASTHPLSFYRQRHDSLSRSSDRDFVDGCVRNARMAQDYWTNRGNPLTSDHAQVLAGIYFFAARHYAECDPAAFQTMRRHLYDVKPDFVPNRPRGLRLLSQIIGYGAAEFVAVRWRRMKRTVRSIAARRADAAVAAAKN